MDRMGLVFLLALALAVAVSLLRPAPARESNRIETYDVSYRTTSGFNVGAIGVVLVLVGLYAAWW